MRASSARAGWALIAMAGVTVLTACTGSSGGSNEHSTPSTSVSPPRLAAVRGIRNPVFYYQGKTPLQPGADLAALGRPSIVVTTPKADEKSAIAAIHSRGAKAYRYVQFYWAPDDEAYEGINLAKHRDWAFCRHGDTPLLGRVTGSGSAKARWHFIDANEKAVRFALGRVLEHLKREGWDGVMFDRGGAALTNAKDAAGRYVWDTASSCTQHPYEQGARFADAYTNMLGLAKANGLGVMLNYGTSPFDPRVPMRPDPADPACQHRSWSRCRFRDDVWNNVDMVLNESVAFPEDKSWPRTFDANRRSEQHARQGKQVVGLITTYTLGGSRNQTRAKVFYEWARVKLFNLALAVNTGNGGCPVGGTTSGVCNRYGTYPELVDIRFGSPVRPEPQRSGCLAGSDIHCVWTRAYADGVDVLNASPEGRGNVRVHVSGHRCRHVYDVYASRALASGRCVRSVGLDLPAWSGRPLVFSASASR